MLLLSARRADRDQAVLSRVFTEDEQSYCCREATLLARRMEADWRFPDPGPACVSVLHVPSDLDRQMEQRQYACATLVFLAVRHFCTADVHQDVLDKLKEPFERRRLNCVEISIAPPQVPLELRSVHGVEKPLKVDIRHACLDGLPPELRAIVPEKPKPRSTDDL